MKRILSLLLALAMISAIGATSLAVELKPAHTPIYTGFWDADAITEKILSETGAERLTDDKARIAAVYDWVIKNCKREGDPDKEYISIASLESKAEQYAERFSSAYLKGKAAIMVPFEDLFEFYDHGYNTEYSLAAYTAEMGIYRVGDCLYFSCLLNSLLGQLGYESYVINGDFLNRDGSRAMHKWNMVYVGGKPYWLDVRMDNAAYASTGEVTHTYFMIEDDQAWAERHDWDADYTDALKAQHDMGRHSYYYDDFDFSSFTPVWEKSSVWAESYLFDAQTSGLIPDILQGKDMTVTISRQEFAALAMSLYSHMAGKEAQAMEESPFTDCDEAYVLAAYSLGIVKGDTETTFAPLDPLTREQAATMLGRAYEAVKTGHAGDGGDLSAGDTQPFADDEEISAYARSYVYYMNANHIIDGKENSLFDPWGKTTREEAIKIAIQMLKTLS